MIKGQALLEVVVGVALLMVGVGAAVFLVAGNARSFSDRADHLTAGSLAREGVAATAGIVRAACPLVASGTYGLQSFPDDTWGFSGSSDVTGKFTRQITITSIDSDDVEVQSSVSWAASGGRTPDVTLATRVTRWPDIAAANVSAPWWNGAFGLRRHVFIRTGENNPLNGYGGYTVRLTGFDTAALVATGDMQADCDDLRVVYYDGNVSVEIDREVLACNTVATEVRFSSQTDIGACSVNGDHYVYYDSGAVGTGPSDLTNVYLWHDDGLSDREASYIQGNVDESGHGYDGTGDNWGDTVAWDPAGYYTYDTDDNFVESFRPIGLIERDIYVEYAEYQTGAYEYDMTSGPMVRWIGSGDPQHEMSDHLYYYEMADSTFLPASPYAFHDDINSDDRWNEVVEYGLLGPFPPNSWTRIGLASWGINPTNLAAWYDASPTPQSRGGWDAARFSGAHSAVDDNEGAGQFGFWIQQDQGRVRNLIARRYILPEPLISLGSEESGS
jgi:hypothetical protein